MGDIPGVINYGAETDDELRMRNVNKIPQTEKKSDKISSETAFIDVPLDGTDKTQQEDGLKLDTLKGDEPDRENFPGMPPKSRKSSSASQIVWDIKELDPNKEYDDDGKTVAGFESESIFSRRMIIAGGFLDIALFTTNCEQLKAILEIGEKNHRYYEIVLGMLIASMVLQIVAGFTLFMASFVTIKNPDDKKKSDIMNHISMGLIALITIINIFISSFTVQSEFITRCNRGEFVDFHKAGSAGITPASRL